MGGYAIWAEENSNLNPGTAGGAQFSWGNGGTGSGNRFVVPPGGDGTVSGLGLNCEASTTGTVEIYKNGSATGATVSVSGQIKNTASVSVAVVAGDALHFRTTSGSGGSGIVATAWIEQVESGGGGSGGRRIIASEGESMHEQNEYRIAVGGTGVAIASANLDGPTRRGRIDVAKFDRVSLEWEPIDGAALAELEAKRSYGGVDGEGVAFASAATLTNTNRRHAGLDVSDCPLLEVDVTAAGDAGGFGILHVYGYTA